MRSACRDSNEKAAAVKPPLVFAQDAAYLLRLLLLLRLVFLRFAELLLRSPPCMLLRLWLLLLRSLFLGMIGSFRSTSVRGMELKRVNQQQERELAADAAPFIRKSPFSPAIQPIPSPFPQR